MSGGHTGSIQEQIFSFNFDALKLPQIIIICLSIYQSIFLSIYLCIKGPIQKYLTQKIY